jgi:hypothetical protein
MLASLSRIIDPSRAFGIGGVAPVNRAAPQDARLE